VILQETLEGVASEWGLWTWLTFAPAECEPTKKEKGGERKGGGKRRVRCVFDSLTGTAARALPPERKRGDATARELITP